MALPVVKHPTYTTELNGQEIEFRNFINAEYKSLLTAIELGDNDSSIATMIDIIKKCVQTDIDINNLHESEVEFLFLQLFIKSVQNKVEGTYTCDHLVKPEVNEEDIDTVNEEQLNFALEITDEEEALHDTEEDTNDALVPCGATFKIIVPIQDAKVVVPEDFEEKSVVKVNDDITINLKKVGIADKRKISKIEVQDEADITYVYKHIGNVIYGDDTLIPDTDFDIEEFKEWFDTFPNKAVEQIASFIKEQPILSYDYVIRCPKCKNTKTLEFRGLNDFFT